MSNTKQNIERIEELLKGKLKDVLLLNVKQIHDIMKDAAKAGDKVKTGSCGWKAPWNSNVDAFKERIKDLQVGLNKFIKSENGIVPEEKISAEDKSKLNRDLFGIVILWKDMISIGWSEDDIDNHPFAVDMKNAIRNYRAYLDELTINLAITGSKADGNEKAGEVKAIFADGEQRVSQRDYHTLEGRFNQSQAELDKLQQASKKGGMLLSHAFATMVRISKMQSQDPKVSTELGNFNEIMEGVREEGYIDYLPPSSKKQTAAEAKDNLSGTKQLPQLRS